MDPISIGILVTLAALAVLFPVGLYVAQRGNGAWGLVFKGHHAGGAGVYRAAKIAIWERGKAPGVVRAAALTSFGLGQMVVPGAVAAVGGLLFLVGDLGSRGREDHDPVLVISALSGPTGVLVAIRLLVAGAAMLRRDPRAPAIARASATFSLVHNVALVALIGSAIVLADPPSTKYGLFCCAYAAVSIAQAVLLLGAARALEAYDRVQAEAPAQAPDELEADAAA